MLWVRCARSRPDSPNARGGPSLPQADRFCRPRKGASYTIPLSLCDALGVCAASYQRGVNYLPLSEGIPGSASSLKGLVFRRTGIFGKLVRFLRAEMVG